MTEKENIRAVMIVADKKEPNLNESKQKIGQPAINVTPVPHAVIAVWLSGALTVQTTDHDKSIV